MGESLIRFEEDMPDRKELVAGWDCAIADHLCTTQKIIMGAKRHSDGTEFVMEIGRIDIMKPFTDDEVRAIIAHRWKLHAPEVPMVVALPLGLHVTERYR